MTASSLYDKSEKFSGIYITFISNRLQVLFFIFIMPSMLVYPFMLWAILFSSLISQFNIWLLSKCFASAKAGERYLSFTELLGKRLARVVAFISLYILLLKMIVFALGIINIVHQYVFPSMNSNWLVIIIFCSCYFLAKQGMSNVIRFVIIVFLSTIWMLLIFIPFFSPSTAALYNLYPLIPFESMDNYWKQLVFVWSIFSGPEFLIVFAPWLKPEVKVFKFLSLANAITTMEYLILFLTSLFFFGSTYLNTIKYPVVDMISYPQFPFIERIDAFFISFHLFNVVYVISILTLLIYGATRIVLGRVKRSTTKIGFTSCWVFLALTTLIINEWLWKSGENQSYWINAEIWSSAFSYMLIPASLFTLIKIKERMDR